MPDPFLSDRVQGAYPRLAANVLERVFTVDNPRPKPGFGRIVRDELRSSGVKLRDVVKDAWGGMRGYG